MSIKPPFVSRAAVERALQDGHATVWREEDRSRMRSIERKLDILISALASEDEGEPDRSLDDGRPISARDNRRGLG